MLLFSDPHRVDPVSFRSFHDDRSLGKHNVQMGLPEGHSVLLHFSHNGRTYQAVLVSMSSAPSKSKKGEHAMWKHVLPISTDFAFWSIHAFAQLCRKMNFVLEDHPDFVDVGTMVTWTTTFGYILNTALTRMGGGDPAAGDHMEMLELLAKVRGGP